jgi:hypothetical protein
MANSVFKYHASSRILAGYNILKFETPEPCIFSTDDLGPGKFTAKNVELCDNNLLQTV